MTIEEKFVQVYEDEKKEKPVLVRTFVIFGTTLPKEMNLPVKITMTGCAPLYLSCSHQAADLFTGFPLSVKQYWRLKWHRWLNKRQVRQIEREEMAGKTKMGIREGV